MDSPLINAIEIVARDGERPRPFINSRRSLLETNRTVLENFNMRTILQRAAINAGLNANPTLNYRQLIDSYNQTVQTPNAVPCVGTLNGFPLACNRLEGQQLNSIDRWFATALVNRFDLAPVNGANCGQQRIILANLEPIGNGRMLMIVESEIPNPRRSCGLEGCRALANFWADLSRIGDVRERQARLEAAFLTGDSTLQAAGFGPFVSANTLGPGGGQIRTNNFNTHPWTLREFHVQRDERLNEMVLIPMPVSNSPHGRLWDDTVPLSMGPQCRSAFLEGLAGLLTDNTAAMSFDVPSECLDAESVNDFSQDYRAHLRNGNRGGYRTALARRIQQLRPGSTLTPEQMANRAQFAGSCIGCHQEAVGRDLGNGVRAPFSLDFVHVSEFGSEDCGDGTTCFEASPALKNDFLPHRKSVLENFLDSPGTTCKAVEDDGRTGRRAAKSWDATPLEGLRTLGGQIMRDGNH